MARPFSWRGASARSVRVSVDTPSARLFWLAGGCALLGLCLLARFFQLQIVESSSYKVLASDQHSLQRALVARRGTMYIRDRADGRLYPIARDRDAWQVYAVPREMPDRAAVGEQVAQLLGKPKEDFFAKLLAPTTTYLVLERDAPYETVERLRAAGLPGIGIQAGLARLYPEPGIGGQLLGFVSLDGENRRVGRYGLEGYFDEVLRGTPGSIEAERDAQGRRLTTGSIKITKAEDGKDIIVTLDRRIQYEACAKMKEAVARFEATGGTVVILDPQDGSILAMCSVPDFDPSSFRTVNDIAVFNNPAIFYQYEPGSVFKPITLAAGLDAGKITPRTTYVDAGIEKIDDYPIRNSDKLAHGRQTMTEVLQKSLNTGTIYVQRLLGKEQFRSYVEKFGFGAKTGVELSTEVAGDVAGLKRRGEVFAATISFGQGMAATPLQMAAAYLPLGNGGTAFRPRIVEAYLGPGGEREPAPAQPIGPVISDRTSKLISAMLVDVVENGHGKRAGVPGYYVAGKTGTAQIPNPNGRGYLADATIGSFVGYAPAEHPRFVMLVKIDRPRTVQYAESSAAPIFGELASFLLSYLQVPPERPIKPPAPSAVVPEPLAAPVPVAP